MYHNIIRTIVPLRKDIQSKKMRKYVTHGQISLLAEERGKMGITFVDVMTNFAMYKEPSSKEVKIYPFERRPFYCRGSYFQGLELTPNFKNNRPQRYYANCYVSQIS